RIVSRHITFRIEEDEENYLEKVAIENDFLMPSGKINRSQTIQYVINKSMKRDQSSEANNDRSVEKSINHLEKLVEQINAAMPHVVLNSYVSAQHTFFSLDKNKSDIIQEEASKYLRETVGQFQDNNYNNTFISYNHRNMKTLPVKKERSKWK
ncbi:hypothetical protein, partial [Piscirickettsia salmonis]|uniref:hypothetical protein n=1 Tax=Piscirickettsia salmonis TaxID=1238 RepID=UPI003EC0912A